MMSLGGTHPSHFNFESSTAFIVGITTAFQVFLGLFNFSLFALVLGSMIRRLDSLATQDQLTGLDNRRTMLEQLANAHAKFLHGGQPYALVLLDLDQFKRVNDRYGYLVGDKSLRTIARRLRAGLREGEVLARYGGDDFLLLLPQTNLASACKHAEHLRTVVANSPISTVRGDVSVTLSIGVTVARQTDADGTSALVRADSALHQARNQGRNCLRVA
jgi:diguanylate cyclase (GGDEF)-like protein